MNTEEMAAFYGTPIWKRLRMHRNPVRMLFSSGVWASAWYLFSSIVLGIALFTVVTAISITSTVLVIICAGLPLLIGTGYFIRGCVVMERGRARAVVPEGLPAMLPMESEEGFFPTLKAVWRDRITSRGLAHFTLLGLPLFILNTIVWTIWLAFLAGVTVPVWYRYIPRNFKGHHMHGLEYGYFPNGPHGKDSIGFWIGSDLSATVAAVAALVLLMVWNYVLVATARVQVNAVRWVFAERDPLATARSLLDSPGPLNSATGAAASPL